MFSFKAKAGRCCVDSKLIVSFSGTFTRRYTLVYTLVSEYTRCPLNGLRLLDYFKQAGTTI